MPCCLPCGLLGQLDGPLQAVLEYLRELHCAWRLNGVHRVHRRIGCALPVGNNCTTFCPSGQFGNVATGACTACESTCVECTGIGQCTRCASGVELRNGVCMVVPPSPFTTREDAANELIGIATVARTSAADGTLDTGYQLNSVGMTEPVIPRGRPLRNNTIIEVNEIQRITIVGNKLAPATGFTPISPRPSPPPLPPSPPPPLHRLLRRLRRRRIRRHHRRRRLRRRGSSRRWRLCRPRQFHPRRPHRLPRRRRRLTRRRRHLPRRRHPHLRRPPRRL